MIEHRNIIERGNIVERRRIVLLGLLGRARSVLVHPLLLLQRLARERRQDEGGPVYGAVVVLAELLLLLDAPPAHRLREIGLGVLGAHHEADLATGVHGDRRVGVADGGEDFLAGLLHVLDDVHVEELVLAWE